MIHHVFWSKVLRSTLNHEPRVLKKGMLAAKFGHFAQYGNRHAKFARSMQ